MKQLLLFTLCTFLFINSKAQLCFDDPACLANICPDSATNLPITADNISSYATTVTVVVPKDTVVGLLTLTYSWIRIDSVRGLPTGFSFGCDPGSCIFPGNTSSCIVISGNPMSAGAGTYQVKAYVTAKLTNWLLGTVYQPDSVTYLRVQIDHVPVCGVPTGLASSAVTGTSATVSWDDMGATNYKLKYKLSTAPAWTTVNTTATSYNLTGLLNCSQYKWNVTAVCAGAGSFKSATKKFTTSGAGCRNGIYIDTDEDLLSIFPNPVNENLTVQYISDEETEQQIAIVSLDGRILIEDRIAMFEGENQFNIPVQELPVGIYFIKIEDGMNTYISKFIKE